MNLKRILVLIMTLTMIVSACAPAIHAFEGIIDVEDTNSGVKNEGTEKDPLVYVSIGDSMTNGYGLPGYDGRSGIVNYGSYTYSNQFAAWLAGYEGEIKDDQVIFVGENGVVDHRQLAMSGLLAEDLHWMLELDYKNQAIIDGVQHLWDAHSWGGGPHHSWYATSEEDRNNLCPDAGCNFCKGNKCCPVLGFEAGFYRTYGDLCDPEFRMANGAARILATYMHPQGNGYGYFTSTQVGNANIEGVVNGLKGNPEFPASGSDSDLLGGRYHFLQIAAEFYQESIKDADIISLALGNTNFGTLMFDFIQDAISNPNDTGFTGRYFIDEIYDYMMDDEVYTPELKEEIAELMGQVDNIINTNFGEEKFEGIETIKYIIRYCVLSYIVNYIAVVNNILTVNPDVELIQVALMNAYEGANSGEDDGSLSMAGMIDMLYNPLNAFIAAVPTLLKNNGDFAESKFYYADCGTVETLTDVFGDDFYTYNGESITYDEYKALVKSPDFDPTKLVHNNSVIRNRFVHWIAGESPYGGYQYLSDAYLRIEFVDHPYANNWGWLDVTSYGELWKYLLGPAECSWTTMEEYNLYLAGQLQREKIFGQYRGMVVTEAEIREFECLSNDEKWARLNSANEDVKNKAFSCAMFACFENAVIRAGQQQFTMNALSEFSGFNENAFKGAFELFAQKMNVESVRSNIEINSLEEFGEVLKVFSDCLLEDPKSAVIMCLANRMEIGTGIGGHPSQGGHDHMYDVVLATYGKYTTEEELDKLVGSSGLDKAFFALLRNEYLTMAQALEIVNGLAERYDLANLGSLELTQDDTSYILGYIYDYLVEHNVEADTRIDIIRTVYAALKGDLLVEYSPALDTIGAIYTRLYEAQLLDNEEAFNIVDFVYERIIDLKVDNQDVYEIATYIYKTLFFTKEEVAIVLLANDDDPFAGLEDYNVALPIDEKIEILEIVFGELNNSEYLEENADLAPMVDLYNDLKSDESISDEAIILIFDMAFESVSEKTMNGGSVDTSKLVAEVTEKILTTDELDVTTKATIANKVVAAVQNSKLPGGSTTIVVPELPDLTKIANILEVLKREGYINESEINDIMGKALDLIINDKLDVNTGVDLILHVYDLVLEDLTLEEKGEFAVVLYDAIKAEYDLTDEEAIKIAAGIIVEYYDEAYAYGYVYADTNGYTDKAIRAINKILNRLDKVDLSDNKMTSAFRVKLEKELDATAATLRELREVIATDKAKDIPGLIATIRALKDDAKTHLVNIYALCKQAGIDFINLPEVQELIDEIDALVDVIVEVMSERIIPLIKEVYGVAEELVPVIIKLVIFAINNYDEVVDMIYTVIDVYHFVYDLLIDTFGSIENAMAVALKICDYIVNIIVKTPGVVDGLTGFVSGLYDIIVSVYGETHNVITTAEAVCDYIIDSLNALNSSILDRIDATTNGNYELKEDSAYVAIGGSTYGPELAKLLNLSNKFTKFGVEDDYFDAIAKADLITIKVNNGEFYEFAYTQLMGTVANILRSNSDLMGWCDNKLVGKEVRATIEQYGIDIDAQTIELEWNKYLNANQKALLDAFLAEVESKVLATGLTETFEIDITSQIEEILEEKGLMLPGVSISVEPIVIPVTDLVVYAVENLVYSYVQFMERTTTLLANIRDIAPDASVVITHVANPLANLPFDISSLVPGFESYTQMFDGVVDALNVYLYALAFVNDNTIFVDSEDAQDIYDALHVFCRHKYDGCTDPDCNICGQVREDPKHSFTDYVKNNDATCTKPGTETAKCDFCDETDTRNTGRPLGHNIIIDASVAATCTKTGLTQGQHCSRCDAKTIPQKVVPALGHDYDYDCDKDCNRCGATRPASHKFGDWTIIEPATYIREGLREHRCIYCGLVERENYEAVKEDVNIVAVIALAVGSLIVAFGSATAIILLIQKKREK